MSAMGFSGGDFGAAPAQIVVGFSKGRDPAAAHKLSDAVVQALSRRWRIHEVPNVETKWRIPVEGLQQLTGQCREWVERLPSRTVEDSASAKVRDGYRSKTDVAPCPLWTQALGAAINVSLAPLRCKPIRELNIR